MSDEWNDGFARSAGDRGGEKAINDRATPAPIGHSVHVPHRAAPTRYDLRAAIADTLAMLRPLLPPDIVVDARLGDVGAAWGTPLDTIELVHALFRGARYALGDRGERIQVSLVRTDGSARIEFAHDGVPAFSHESIRSLSERAGGQLHVGARERGEAVSVHLPLARADDERTVDLHDRTILIAAGTSGPVGRLTEALEAAGAEVALCLDADDAVRTAGDADGAWDLAIVAGAMRGRNEASVAAALREADSGLPVAIAVRHRAANDPGTIGERDTPDMIARTAFALMHGTLCAS